MIIIDRMDDGVAVLETGNADSTSRPDAGRGTGWRCSAMGS